MIKYFIVPKTEFKAEISADSKAEAIAKFAAEMDSDMNNYFEVVTEDEMEDYLSRAQSNAHDKAVIGFMENELETEYGYAPDIAEEIAENAYDIYCEGKRDITEYQSIEEAIEAYLEENGDEEN